MRFDGTSSSRDPPPLITYIPDKWPKGLFYTKANGLENNPFLLCTVAVTMNEKYSKLVSKGLVFYCWLWKGFFLYDGEYEINHKAFFLLYLFNDMLRMSKSLEDT